MIDELNAAFAHDGSVILMAFDGDDEVLSSAIDVVDMANELVDAYKCIPLTMEAREYCGMIVDENGLAVLSLVASRLREALKIICDAISR